MAAILHGAPFGTVDVDLWVDLPVRQYVRILTIAQRLGAHILSGSLLGLSSDQRVDFIYEITGLASFATEWKRAVVKVWAGQTVKILPLERIIRSKEAAGRPKDLGQLPVLRDYLASQKISRGKT